MTPERIAELRKELADWHLLTDSEATEALEALKSAHARIERMTAAMARISEAQFNSWVVARAALEEDDRG
jgi:hypothetical protein